MTYTISPDRKTLTIKADASEQAALRECWDQNIESNETMYNVFEHLICNSELEWINPADTGDLTDAPMLGILGEEQRDDATPRGYQGPKVYTGPGMIQPILERWAFMDYALRSPLVDLRDKGEAVFVDGSLSNEPAEPVLPICAQAMGCGVGVFSTKD